MKPINLKTQCVLAAVIAGLLVVAPAVADNDSSRGGHDKSEKRDHKEKRKQQKNEKHDDERKSWRGHNRSDVKVGGHFGEQHRTVVHNYYGQQFANGRCPPGLARKNNGCLPPGQAKKWTVGQPLPQNIVYYNVPQPLLSQLGQAPAGYRYAQVDDNVLLIQRMTGMVVDALQLGQ